MSSEKIAPAIGIDLGTTNSCVALVKDGHLNMIPLQPESQNSLMMPTAFALDSEGQPLVGAVSYTHLTLPTKA